MSSPSRILLFLPVLSFSFKPSQTSECQSQKSSARPAKPGSELSHQIIASLAVSSGTNSYKDFEPWTTPHQSLSYQSSETTAAVPLWILRSLASSYPSGWSSSTWCCWCTCGEACSSSASSAWNTLRRSAEYLLQTKYTLCSSILRAATGQAPGAAL